MKSSKTNHIDLLTVNQLLTNSTGSGSTGSGSTSSSSTGSGSTGSGSGSGSGSTGSSSTGSGSTNRLARNLFSVMLLAVLATGFFINGCAKQTLGEGNGMKDRNNDGSYNIGYSFDGVISSKSDFIDSESEIKDAYLVFYTNNPDPSEQKYVAYQEVIINNNSTSFPLPIPGDLDPNVKYKVLILGNYNSNKAGGIEFEDLPLTNKTYTEHKRLFYAETVGRLSEDLPFSGILQKIGDITEAESLFTCPDKNTVDLGVKVKFTRSVSRFDIINNVADQLVITRVKVCNYRDGGYFYHSESFKGSVVSGIKDDEGWLAVEPLADENDKKQTVHGGLYGYPNLVLSTAQGDEFTTCLIIEGYYQNPNTGAPSNNDKLSYYRANISRNGDPQLLYSNRIYTIIINGVKEAGSDDAEGAYKDTNNELDYKTDGDWGAGDDNSSVDEDGNYIIVSRTDIVFDSSGDLYETITVWTKDDATWEADWEGMTDGVAESPYFGFKMLDNKSLQVFTKGVNDEKIITKNGTIRLKLEGDLADVFVDIALIQMPSSEEHPVLTVDGQLDQMDIDVLGNSTQLRYRVSTGASNASWVAVDDENSLSFASSFSTSGAHNEYFTIDFESNLTGAEREGSVIIKRVPENGVADVTLTFTQIQSEKRLVIYAPLGFELEGFRKNTADVRGYNETSTGGIGHGSSNENGQFGGEGGYVYFNVGGTKQLYAPYTVHLKNPDDYTWEATTTFNIKDLGMINSSIDLNNVLLPPLMSTTVKGKSGESIHLFIHTTGPGDPDIEGTLIIKAIPNDENAYDAFEEQYPLTITTNCDIGETQVGGTIWDDRNIGNDVPFKIQNGKPTVAKYYTNEFPNVNARYKGDRYTWYEAMTDGFVCPLGWRLPTWDELKTLVSTDMRFSKYRPFMVSDERSNVFPFDYTGAWFSYAGRNNDQDNDDIDVYGYYWSSTTSTKSSSYAYSLFFESMNGIYDYLKTFYFSVRCVKDVDTAP